MPSAEIMMARRKKALDIHCPMCGELFWSGRLRQEHLTLFHGWVTRLPRTVRGDRPQKGFCHCGKRHAHARGMCTTCLTRERRAFETPLDKRPR